MGVEGEVEIGLQRWGPNKLTRRDFLGKLVHNPSHYPWPQSFFPALQPSLLCVKGIGPGGRAKTRLRRCNTNCNPLAREGFVQPQNETITATSKRIERKQLRASKGRGDPALLLPLQPETTGREKEDCLLHWRPHKGLCLHQPPSPCSVLFVSWHLNRPNLTIQETTHPARLS